MLKLFYITNKPEIAKIAESAGVDRIFVDLETIGKQARQGGMDTVQSHHTTDDVRTIHETLTKAELLVRTNPIYSGSKEEINTVIENGADIVMLPYFKTVDEVSYFINCVAGRARVCLLLETKEAVDCIDELLTLSGIDEIHIGLNDLHLSYGLKFMFELVANGTVEMIVSKIKRKNIPYGFGGIAKLGAGALPAEVVITEHYRLGSTMAILSRSFCNTDKVTDFGEVCKIFQEGLFDIRKFEQGLLNKPISYFMENHNLLVRCVDEIINQ